MAFFSCFSVTASCIWDRSTL